MSSYIQIGSGKVFLNPIAGNLAASPQPVKALTIQSVEIDISGTIEELKGEKQFPDDIAVTDKKGSGKMVIGRKDLSMLNQVFFADAVSTGGLSVVPDFPATIPAVTTFTITVIPPNTGTFSEDLGVLYASTGIPLQRVTVLAANGQYTVAAGVYTFFGVDPNPNVLISYSYTMATQGSLFSVSNQLIGWGPTVEIFVVDAYQPVIIAGRSIFSTMRIYAAKINKVTVGNKRDKYSMPELDFSYFANSAGKVIDLYSNV